MNTTARLYIFFIKLTTKLALIQPTLAKQYLENTSTVGFTSLFFFPHNSQ